MRRAALNVYILKKDNSTIVERIIQTIKGIGGDLCTITIFDNYRSMKSRLNNSVGLVVISCSRIQQQYKKERATQLLQSNDLIRNVFFVHDDNFQQIELENLVTFKKASIIKSYFVKANFFLQSLKSSAKNKIKLYVPNIRPVINQNL